MSKKKEKSLYKLYNIIILFLVVSVKKAPLDRICRQWIKASFTQVWRVRIVQNGLLGLGLGIVWILSISIPSFDSNVIK